MAKLILAALVLYALYLLGALLLQNVMQREI